MLFFFNDTSTTEIYTLSLHDALPIWQWTEAVTPVSIANYELLMRDRDVVTEGLHFDLVILDEAQRIKNSGSTRSEEHTSELQSHVNLVCRLLLEKKKNKNKKLRSTSE